jgi:mannosyl-oligosaccharide alpha-1,3-glucosidase
MILSFGIAGLPFIGADVGGFFDNPDEVLLIRWYQLGSFYPFFRAHAELRKIKIIIILETKRREPWLFSEEALRIIRESIVRRYTLLPYYYTLFHESSINGSPVNN